MQELKNAIGRVYLTIDTDAENRWVAVEWMGYLTAESIKAGAQAYTDALAASGFSCVPQRHPRRARAVGPLHGLGYQHVGAQRRRRGPPALCPDFDPRLTGRRLGRQFLRPAHRLSSRSVRQSGRRPSVAASVQQ